MTGDIETNQSAESGRKTALLTGGTSGIGRAILPVLLENDFNVHFIGTNASKGAQIENELNTPNGPKCTFIQLDLTNLRGVREFAQSFLAEVPRLDLLLNVAGLMLPNRQMTSEGFETTFAVDYLAAFILCRELTPALEAARPSRIVNVAGLAKPILKQRLDFDDLMFEKRYGHIRAILDSVHAKTVMTEILSEQLRPRGIDVNSFDPGNVSGGMARHLTFPKNVLSFIIGVLTKHTETEDCPSGNYVSTAQELEGITGQFFDRQLQKTPLSFDQDYKDRLWRETEKLLEPIYGDSHQ